MLSYLFSPQISSVLLQGLKLMKRSQLHPFIKKIIKILLVMMVNSHFTLSNQEGAGSYLTMYIWLLTFLRNLNLAETQGKEKIKQFLEKNTEYGFNEKDLLQRAEISYKSLLTILHAKEKSGHKIQISYYFGGPGLYLNGCILSYMKKDPESFHHNLKAILSYKSIIHSNRGKYYKEILYGVSGYLHTLLVVQKLIQKEISTSHFYANLEKDVEEMVNLIINEGIESYDSKVDLNHLPQDFRLVYTFHETEYFGAAHGLFGVLYTLLSAYHQNYDFFNKEKSSLTKILLTTVKASLKYLLEFQMDSGNFPSRKKKHSSNPSVQFCHGSPGAVQCLLLASEIFKDEKLGKDCFEAALLAGEDIWKHGILKKGYGLCHGITGNGYNFLTLYRYTRDITWLYRAYCFVITKDDKHYREIIENYDFGNRYKVGVSDYPYSLMLGLAGDICFEVDCLLPEHAK